MTVGGARTVHSKHKHHHCPLSYTPIKISHVGKLQMRCLVSGTGVTEATPLIPLTSTIQKHKVELLKLRC